MTAEQRQWEINYRVLALLMTLVGGTIVALLFMEPMSSGTAACEWGLSICATNGVPVALWLLIRARDAGVERRGRLNYLFIMAFLVALSIGVLSYIALFLCLAANFAPRSA